MKHLIVAIVITILALLLLAWVAWDANAQGFENVCTCYGVPGCWFVAEYTRDGQPGDGAWEWVPLWSEMLRWQVREFGAGWTCSHGGMEVTL